MPVKLHHLLLICLVLLIPAQPARALAPETYYVSSVSGSDANDGRSPTTAFKTITRVNNLALNPGDRVLFACGETWRVQPLNVQRSGTAGSPVTFGSNPPGCANKPRLLGTYAVSGWVRSSGNIYVANLNAGDNAGRFPDGVNQLFRDGRRLTMGRWPNLGSYDNGYSTIDSQPGENQLTDDQIPTANWKGATIHLKVIRWSMINRDVTAISGGTITLNSSADCWGGSCKGWGYFLNNSLAAVDQEGEWYYDKAARKVYLYTTQPPSNSAIEASVVLPGDDRNRAAVNLGGDHGKPVSYVVVDNLEIRGWFNHGIASPTNLTNNENSFITISNNDIFDVDDSGINLFTWVYNADDGQDGWRGGNNINIQGNRIDGANSFGIHTPSRDTTIQTNSIRNIGLAANLNEAGMGCGKTGGEGSCTENGTGLRIYIDDPARSGYGFSVRYNVFENIGYHGIQMFGHSSSFHHNVFDRACISKGDCGAINTFGSGVPGASNVHDLTVTNNIIRDTIGNTDGCRSDFKTLFGFGLYYDNASRNVTSSENTIIRSTAAGMLYQNSTGSATNNTFFNNAAAFTWGTQVVITGSASRIDALTGNIFFVNDSHAAHLQLDNLNQLGGSDNNRFYHAWRGDYISAGGSKTLAQWKVYSGKDVHSTATALSWQRMYWIYVNDTGSAQDYTFDPVHSDLDGNALTGGLTLEPYTSKILSFVPLRLFLPSVNR